MVNSKTRQYINTKTFKIMYLCVEWYFFMCFLYCNPYLILSCSHLNDACTRCCLYRNQTVKKKLLCPHILWLDSAVAYICIILADLQQSCGCHVFVLCVATEFFHKLGQTVCRWRHNERMFALLEATDYVDLFKQRGVLIPNRSTVSAPVPRPVQQIWSHGCFWAIKGTVSFLFQRTVETLLPSLWVFFHSVIMRYLTCSTGL